MLCRIIIIFVPNAGTLPYLQGGPKFTLGSPAPWTPHRGKIVVPEASILPHVIVLLISTF